jgi:tetratricopeptide (TPR) repeat protein
MYRPQQQQPYSGKAGQWWTVAIFGWLAFMSSNSFFWIMFLFFAIRLVADVTLKNRSQQIPQQRGPMEKRREQQMRKYEQIPNSSRSTPQATVKANPYKESGIKKYKNFDLQDAIEDFEKGLAIAPNDVALHFNIACAYSLTEQKTKSYNHLAKAVSLGLKDVDKILQHDDLAYIRIQPEFEEFRKSGFLKSPYSQETTTVPQAEQVADDTTIDASLLSNLKRLSEMRQKGIISDEEFAFERKKILRQ